MFVIGSAAPRGPFRLPPDVMRGAQFTQSGANMRVTYPGSPWSVHIGNNRVRIHRLRDPAPPDPHGDAEHRTLERILLIDSRPFELLPPNPRASLFLLPEAATDRRHDVLAQACAAMSTPYTRQINAELRVFLPGHGPQALQLLLFGRLAVRAAQVLALTAALNPERRDLETLLTCSAAHLPTHWPRRAAL